MKKLSVMIIAFAIILNTAAVFAKGNASQWAKEYIESVEENGLVPDSVADDYTQALTRREFTHIAIRMISAVYSAEESELVKYADTKAFDDTDDVYVAAAHIYGIIDGVGNKKFAPNEKITREEAAKILVKTYEFCAADNGGDNVNTEYTDDGEISDWAYEYVNKVSEMSIMQGFDDGRFDPKGIYTREQGIVTFLRLFEYITENDIVSAKADNKNPKIEGMLSVRKGVVTNGAEDVVLNGINLGGWLLMEQWMSPADSDVEVAYADIIDVLTSRFGKEKTDELIKTYEDSYITEADFAFIEALGFNCVRVPFWYRNFTDEDGKISTDSRGFEKLDWVLDMCKKYNIYAILDMHGCPGGQSMNHGTGSLNKNELYTSEKNLRTMEKLWVEIAKRYKDNIYVAAYDIMNEPQNNEGAVGKNAWAAESETAVRYTNAVYDRMIKAIREVDKKHIITVEGVWSLDVLPAPAAYNWSNMMYQLHIYDTEKRMIDLRVGELVSVRERYGVAPLAGEYNSKIYERYAKEKYDENKISRIKWTYKTVGVSYDGWGLLNKNTKKTDIKSASYDEIKKAFGTEMLTEKGFELNLFEYNMIAK